MIPILRLLVLCFTIVSFGQEFNIKEAEGVWKGKMELFNQARKLDTQPEVTLTITPMVKDSIWSWRTDYSDSRYGDVVKDYTLISLDRLNGKYLIDEGNGIRLEQQLSGSSMFGLFELDDQILMASYRFYDDEIHFEVISSVKTKDSSQVRSHPVRNRQTVVLKRFVH